MAGFFSGVVQEIYTGVTLPPRDFTEAIKKLRADGYIQAKPFKWTDFASRFNDVYKNVEGYKMDLVRAGVFVAPFPLPTFPDNSYVPDYNKIERQNAVENALENLRTSQGQRSLIVMLMVAVGGYAAWKLIR